MSQTIAHPLLANAPVSVTLTTTDVNRSATFYQNLGLTISNQGDDSFIVNCGNNTSIYVYRRNEPPRATNTVAVFRVDDLDATANALRENGIVFEEYDLPELQTVNGIATVGEDRVAWIKDPDGNILGIGTN